MTLTQAEKILRERFPGAQVSVTREFIFRVGRNSHDPFPDPVRTFAVLVRQKRNGVWADVVNQRGPRLVHLVL